MKDVWQPEQYAKFESERSRPFYDLLDGVGTLSKSPHVVDLGCGSGELTRELHRRVKAMGTLGVDNSEAMLAKARSGTNPESSEGGRLDFLNADLAEFCAAPERADKFDLVFSNAALQWCGGHSRILESIFTLLRPSGRLAVQVPANQDYPTHRLFSEMIRESKWAASFPAAETPPDVLRPERYAEELFRIGFSEPRVRLEVYGHVFPDREFVLEWVKGTLLGFARARLSPEAYSEFLAEYRERLLRELANARPFFYPFKRILFWAFRPGTAD